MKVVIDRKLKRYAAGKKQLDDNDQINKDETYLRTTAAKEKRKNNAREYYAASKIQAIVTGFLDRIVCNKLRKEARAISLINRVFKGKVGRMRWKREYYRSISVVKSDRALAELLDRSTELRSETIYLKKGKTQIWKEYFDPLSDSFWYYNTTTKQNTWQCPLVFQKTLICPWLGYASFGDMPHQKACRSVLGTMEEYRNHLRTAHTWYCMACFQRNSGLNFPHCHLCGNKISGEGEDGEKELLKNINKVKFKLGTFLHHDVGEREAETYNIKERIIGMSLDRKRAKEETMRLLHEAEDSASAARNELSTPANTKRILKELDDVNKNYLRSAQMSYKTIAAVENMIVANMSNALFAPPDEKEIGGKDGEKAGMGAGMVVVLPPIPGATGSNNNKNKTMGGINTGITAVIPKGNDDEESVASYVDPSKTKYPVNTEGPSRLRIGNTSLTETMKTQFGRQQKEDEETAPNTARTVSTLASTIEGGSGGGGGAQRKPILKPEKEHIKDLPQYSTVVKAAEAEDYARTGGYAGELERFRDPMTKGIFSQEDFDFLTTIYDNEMDAKMALDLYVDDDDSANGDDIDSSDEEEEVEEEVGADDENGAEQSDHFDENGLSSKQHRQKHAEGGTNLTDSVHLSKRVSLAIKATEAERIRIENSRLERENRGKQQKEEEKEAGGKEGGGRGGDDSGGLDGSVPSSGGKIKSLVNVIPKKMRKLTVCPLFLKGECKLVSSCPLAHPGLRDNAKPKIRSKKDKKTGKRVKSAYVYVCMNEQGLPHTCELGKECPQYHMYVRPSTQELILSIYPTAEGTRSKEFPGGANLHGRVKRGEFNGYGIMTWPNNATYMGDWKDDLRDGFGIYRTRDGMEYVGCYKKGVRHGWGSFMNSNGEEYIGQWADGKMEGLGVLNTRYGDVYEGYFKNNLYHGIGSFKRANGDLFMGNCYEGNAGGGLGILLLSNGELYKGHFDRNMRHGRGACAYANGSRYAGQWYRGVHHGFGIYISPEGEKYIGEWAAGKKHGKGRYCFKNGDFYDGEFYKNKAKGMGFYYHANGNMYHGMWDNDMRNGRGTYNFVNGSKYTGVWLDNDIHFKGRFDFATGAFYRGQFKKNLKHGKGVYYWPNGNQYTGEFFDDKMCGIGEMKYLMGHRYVGMWRDNRKNGEGAMYYAGGPIYEGEWVDDIRCGKGKLTFLKGYPIEESYDGEWSEDKWHGKGTYTYRKDEGTVYVGDWEMGHRHGKGTITYKDGSFYRGDFINDQMWGKGVYVAADKTQYDGEWRANMRHGIGTYIGVDGVVYKGEFLGNMKHGRGTLYRQDGSKYTGQWFGNNIIGEGVSTIVVGKKEMRDGLPKEVSMKVFSF